METRNNMSFSQLQKDLIAKLIQEAMAPLEEKVAAQQQEIESLRVALGQPGDREQQRQQQQQQQERTDEQISELRANLNASNQDNAVLKEKIVDVNIEHDNLESYGRRMNARIEGLEFREGETSDELFTKIESALRSVDVTLQKNDLVRWHRTSAPVRRDGKMVAQTIVKFSRWSQRREVHFANKRAREQGKAFRIHGDLTRRRHSLLLKAREMLAARYPGEGGRAAQDAPFAYADVNSNLRIRRGETVRSFNTSTEMEQALSDLE